MHRSYLHCHRTESRCSGAAFAGIGLLLMVTLGACTKSDLSVSQGAGSDSRNRSDKQSDPFRHANEAELLAKMDATLIELAEQLFSAIKHYDVNGAMQLMISDEVIPQSVGPSQSDSDSLEQAAVLLKQLASPLSSDVKVALDEVQRVAEKAAINWDTTTIVSISSYGKKLANRSAPLDTFAGINLIFVDSQRPEEKLLLKLGGGVRLDDRWLFTRAWKPIERLD